VRYFDPWERLLKRIEDSGGFVNAHAHFDRAYTITEENLDDVVYDQLHNKWLYVDRFKESATMNDYCKNIQTALFDQRAMGVTSCLSFIDIDSVVSLKALRAAGLAKEYAKGIGIDFKVATQTLKGVVSPYERIYLEMALDTGVVDIIGSLPGADAGMEDSHLDIIFQLAKRYDKRIHVHVDQLNSPEEKETELLARKTMQHSYEDMVTAVHSISLAAHPATYREEVYKMASDSGLSFIACPTAWIDSRRNEVLTPTHNAITPVDEMILHDLVVAIGSDNIHDVYKPYSTGDMATELKFLLEATHIYDQEVLVKIATENGLKVMGSYVSEDRRISKGELPIIEKPEDS
jgi:cytosine/adenosine deaminase-related metal-dependent hydrolase